MEDKKTPDYSHAAKWKMYRKLQPLWFTAPPIIKPKGPLSAHFEPKGQPRTSFKK